MDNVEKAIRSKIMRAVKGKNTKPEVEIRHMLFKLGYRYRIHVKKLPGTPDIVFPIRKKVIFINGCFWHGHKCKLGRLPKSNIDFWRKKIEKNRQRDKQVIRELKKMGWKSKIVWQCQIKNEKSLLQKIIDFLESEV